MKTYKIKWLEQDKTDEQQCESGFRTYPCKYAWISEKGNTGKYIDLEERVLNLRTIIGSIWKQTI